MARIGKSWTKAEEDEVLAHVTDGLTFAEIAVLKQRTTGGIRARLTRIACLLVEQKMSLYEAAGRTGIKVVRIQEALERKMEEETAKVCPSKMEFTFATTTSREELRGAPLKAKIACLQSIADQQSQPVEGHARHGHTSYFWEVDDTALERFMIQRGMGQTKITLQEVMGALRTRYPGCKVELVEEWVDQVGRGAVRGVQTRILKTGIKIDWS